MRQMCLFLMEPISIDEFRPQLLIINKIKPTPMMKIAFRMFRFSSNRSIHPSDANQQILHSRKQEMLKEVAENLKIQLRPPIVISDEVNPLKRLSQADKLKLGIYIPQSPFNPRLTKAVEKEYLPSITKELYVQQKQNLQTYIRILQNNLFLQESGVTLDHYVNVIYKDIYARYLISKGVGIQWEGYCASHGAVNAHNADEYYQEAKLRENYSILLDFIESNIGSIRKDRSIGLYSYHQRKYIHHSKINVEKTKKIGYYIKQPLTDYGIHANQFNILEEKQSKVYLLVFVEYLEKLVNPNAICINGTDRMIMLKRLVNSEELQTQYLITSLDTFKQHEKYFKKLSYEKHNTFDAKYLISMKCMDVPFVQELPEYYRKPNCYLVNSNHHMADFERVKVHNLVHTPSQITESGLFITDNNKSALGISDVRLTQKLQQRFTEAGLVFMDFYDVFDDEVYFDQKTNEVLKFRIGDKYFIPIPETNSQSILEGFARQETIISESKIIIPRVNPGRRPRQKRLFRKERKMKLEQVTEHTALEQAIRQFTTISISSLSQTLYSIPLFLKEGNIVSFEEVLDQQQLSLLLEGRIDQLNFGEIEKRGYEIRQIYASNELLKCLLYLQNLTKSKDIFNVIIEPQSESEVLVPASIHLNYMINKAKKGRGRRSSNLEIKSNISLIKLHPTFTQQNRDLSVKQLIEGTIKSNSKEQYGLGLEAVRLWTAANDNFLGDRQINDEQINKQLRHSQSIRKIFWNLMSLIPEQTRQITPTLYISKFMLDMIDSYINSMEQCYKNMNINQAYLLTVDFFEHIVNEIYVKTIKKKIIAYPNLEENQQHFYVIRRIMELVAVIYPLFPFTAYHISRKNVLKWPLLLNGSFYESIPLHNEMIKTRVLLRNKLLLNRLNHAQLYCPSLKQAFSERDLELFFDLNKVSLNEPQKSSRACSLRLSKNNSVSAQQKLIIYESDQFCLRCEHKSKQTEYLCKTCVDYLEENVGQSLMYFPMQISHTNKKIDEL